MAAWPTLGMPFPLPGASRLLLPTTCSQGRARGGKHDGFGPQGATSAAERVSLLYTLWLSWLTDVLQAVSVCASDRLWGGLGAHPAARPVRSAMARRCGPDRQGAHWPGCTCPRPPRRGQPPSGSCRKRHRGSGGGGAGAVWQAGVAAAAPAGFAPAAATGGGRGRVRCRGDLLHGAAAAAVARPRLAPWPAAAAAAAAARQPGVQRRSCLLFHRMALTPIAIRCCQPELQFGASARYRCCCRRTSCRRAGCLRDAKP